MEIIKQQVDYMSDDYIVFFLAFSSRDLRRIIALCNRHAAVAFPFDRSVQLVASNHKRALEDIRNTVN